jgi:hypothetical protein
LSNLIDEDPVQFFGSSPDLQIAPFGEDQYYAGLWLTQEADDLLNNDPVDALFDAAEVAAFEAGAFFWWMSAKLDPFALNVVYSDLSHSDLHTAGVWSSISHDCGLSQ